MNRFVSLLVLSAATLAATAQSFNFDLTKAQPNYTEATGYGYDFVNARQQSGHQCRYFSVRVPDGNYRVTFTVGSRRHATDTQVRAESRRLLVEHLHLKKGQLRQFTFIINKRSPRIDARHSVSIKPRERQSLDWDDKLTIDFAGANPAIASLKIDPDTTATTLYLCGNSTVVDQPTEPWASWGQMITRWFNDKVAVSNHAESGLTAGSFLAQHRLDKIMATLRAGDYVLCEFGHNDQKEHGAGAGAWYNFSYNLKQFIDRVRQRGANIVFVTPTQRRFFTADGKIKETHGDYPDAMRAVARREHVPVIELHNLTRTFFETLGVEQSKRALVQYAAGTFPGQTTALADNTHFNPYGAYEVARMVAVGMHELGLPIAANLDREAWQYSPAHPDPVTVPDWQLSPFFDNQKPDGN